VPISEILEAYLLGHDLDPSSEAWYRRIVAVFKSWFGGDVPPSALTPEMLSAFLRDKRHAGNSSHYCKSLRSGLLAVLGNRVDSRLVRSVKLDRLRPHSWNADSLERLAKALDVLPERKRVYYARISAVAYHTGLSKNDLHRLTRPDFEPDGTLVFDRHKTGAEVVAWVPVELLIQFPATGLMFPQLWSYEQFRKDFKKVVQAAGLEGTFKTLRKTSGTEADLINGRGHEHLANTRAVFERHYKDRQRVHREPVRLPQGFWPTES